MDRSLVPRLYILIDMTADDDNIMVNKPYNEE